MASNMEDETPTSGIGDKTVDGAVEYLKETDVLHAEKKAQHSHLVELRKSVKSAEFLAQESGTVQAREASAYNSEAYRKHLQDIEDIEVELFTLTNKRKRAELVVEIWRTRCANQRRGNL